MYLGFSGPTCWYVGVVVNVRRAKVEAVQVGHRHDAGFGKCIDAGIVVVTRQLMLSNYVWSDISTLEIQIMTRLVG